ncbi:MAG TPA: hypothetical protein VMY37_35095 [Thermoguttaceae bacterium]|nr:hypothetical protein [Thermoguttaceae bacterium]
MGLACVLVWAGIASAETVPTIVGVEEDWELVLATPDPDSAGPQVICAMSPFANVESLHCTLELNHRTVPVFAPGGLQFEVWNGEQLVTERRAPTQSILSQPGEVICWTQKMELSDGTLHMEVVEGSSTTWGSFGGLGYLKADVSTTLENLNSYHPSVSVENSGISYAANRVQSLVLKRVRVTTSEGEVLEDSTARPVYQQ